VDALRLPALLPRGVAYAEYLIDGCHVLQAIDRYGNCIKRVRVKPDVDPEVIWTWLEGYLENRDPERHLRIIPGCTHSVTPINIAIMLRLIRVRALRQRQTQVRGAFVGL
jgi:hypothetical protein